MRFGIAVPNFSRLGTRDIVVEVARQAEALGYDSIWTTDHVMMARGQEEPYGHVLEALTTLSYLAALTERIKLGISVIVLPQRNPVVIAKETATLDYLSGGRLIVGLGAGWNAREFAFIGADFENRGKRFDEYIRAMRELWTSPDPRFDGHFVQFADVLFSPRPIQAGGPPIVIGGYSKATFRRAASLADGWHSTGVSPSAYADGLRQIRERAGSRRVIASARMRAGIDRRLPEQRAADGSIQTVLDGPREAIVARLEEYRAAGADEIVFSFPNDTAEGFMTDLRRYAEEIIPRFQTSA